MITEADAKTRKQWLINLFAITMLNEMFIIYKTLSSGLAPNMPWWFNYYFIPQNIILSIVFLWITYRCAYKKPGTKLLTFFIILTPFSILINVVLFLMGKLPQISGSWIEQSILLLQQAAGLWLLFLNWKMRLINKKLQRPPETA